MSEEAVAGVSRLRCGALSGGRVGEEEAHSWRVLFDDSGSFGFGELDEVRSYPLEPRRQALVCGPMSLTSWVTMTWLSASTAASGLSHCWKPSGIFSGSVKLSAPAPG